MNLLLRSAMIFFATLMAAGLVALADPAAVERPTVSRADPVKAASQLLAGLTTHDAAR
jgi:hypothetical protein